MSLIREPVICLDYNEKDKATVKELLVDYTNGNMYVVSASDKSVIFNITEKIAAYLSDNNSLTVTIDGIGETNLEAYINSVNNIINNSIMISDEGDEKLYIPEDSHIDSKSMEIYNNIVQIKGYHSAQVFAVPCKGSDGNILWVPLEDLKRSITESIASDNNDGNAGGKVAILEPNNFKIYLQSTVRQMSKALSGTLSIYLPMVIDEYTKIEWMVKNSNAQFTFIGSNIQNAPVSITADKVVVYKFETWDSGNTWVTDIN